MDKNGHVREAFVVVHDVSEVDAGLRPLVRGYVVRFGGVQLLVEEHPHAVLLLTLIEGTLTYAPSSRTFLVYVRLYIYIYVCMCICMYVMYLCM